MHDVRDTKANDIGPDGRPIGTSPVMPAQHQTVDHGDMLSEHEKIAMEYNPPPPILMVNEMVYYRPPEGDLIGVVSNYEQELDNPSNEEAYHVLKARVGEDWIKLDVGWIKSASLICLKNEETMRNTWPTEEQKEQDRLACLLLTFSPENPSKAWVLAKGTSFRGCPVSLDGLHIRCYKGTTQYTLTVIPK